MTTHLLWSRKHHSVQRSTKGCPSVCYNFVEPTEKASAVVSLKIREAENSDGYEAD